MDDTWEICTECDGSIDGVEDYTFGVDIDGEVVYLHEYCRQSFIDRTGYGFCDLCDGLTWVAGYHEDTLLYTDTSTGNHVVCEAEYAARNS